MNHRFRRVLREAAYLIASGPKAYSGWPCEVCALSEAGYIDDSVLPRGWNENRFLDILEVLDRTESISAFLSLAEVA